MCWTTEETAVKLSRSVSDDVIHLSTLDQHAVRIYSSFVVVFKAEGKDGIHDAIQHVKNGLAEALCQYPDFAATVMPKPGSSRNELELHIGPESGVPFRTVDHSSRIGDSQACHELLRGRSYGELEEVNFPLTRIPDEALFVPFASPGDLCPLGMPGLLVQANIIDDGLLLGVTWHHTVSDARGMGTLLKAWARGTNMSCTPGSAGNAGASAGASSERWRLSYGTRGATIADLPEYVADASARSPGTGRVHLLDRKFPPPADSRMSTWQIRPEAMQSLVSLLNSSGQGNTEQYTRIEAMSALLWKHLSRARQIHVSFPEASSLFTTRVDYRRRLFPPLPHEYIGNANQPIPRTRVSVQEVCSPSTPQSLGTLAGAIRRAVAENDDGIVRKLIGFIDTLPLATDLALVFDTCPGPDMAITDSSGLDLMLDDWGKCLGRAVCIRLFVRYRGFSAFLPQGPDGGFQMVVQCEESALQRLRADAVFGRYAECLC